MPQSGREPPFAGVRLGLGCLRLPGGDAGVAVIHAALAGGIGLLDTADVYGAEPGDGERLVAAALAGWTGPPALVATKVGLTRPAEGRWVPDGRARALTAAAEASCRRLGRTALDLLFLHAPDPRVAITTSVRALAALRDAGVARAIGVANVSLRQLDDALAAAPVDAVQIKLGPQARAAIDGGIVARCRARGITVFAHTPLGGPQGVGRLPGDPEMAALAARLGCTAAQAALAWTLAVPAIPLVGASRVETARAAAAVLSFAPAPVSLPVSMSASLSDAAASPAPSGDGEIVVILGSPGAGKSTAARELVAAGYDRLNRDLSGRTLGALAAELGRRLAAGGRRFVLDNTYPTRRSRAAVIAAARAHGVPVRCVVLAISPEDAQVNACERIVARHGRLLEPDEMVGEGDVPPRALYQFQRGFEPPEADEGFAAIETRPFVRARAAAAGARPAAIVELDGIVWRSRGGARTPRCPDDVELVPGRAERLAAAHRDGTLVLATTWQPELGAAEVAACLERLRGLLDVPLDVGVCLPPAGPPVCWCRKPLPGLGVVLARRHGLDAARTVHIGARPADRGFAARLGFGFVDASEWFGP